MLQKQDTQKSHGILGRLCVQPVVFKPLMFNTLLSSTSTKFIFENSAVDLSKKTTKSKILQYFNELETLHRVCFIANFGHMRPMVSELDLPD